MTERDEVRAFVQNQLSLMKNRTENKITYPDNECKHKRAMWVRVKQTVSNFLDGLLNQNVLIMPGLRGVGKTTLLFQVIEHFYYRNEKFDEGHVLYLSCNDLSAQGYDLATALRVYEANLLGKSVEKLRNEEKVLLLIDEAHYEEKWGEIIKSYSDRSDNIFIIVTGSSSLSLETSTDLARRRIEEKVFPLRFFEYILFKKHAKGRECIYPPGGLMSDIFTSCFEEFNAKERIERMSSQISRLRRTYFTKLDLLDKEIEDFLVKGGLPISIQESDDDALHQSLLEVSTRVAQEDLGLLPGIGPKIQSHTPRILKLIASEPNMATDSIAQYLSDISKTSVFNVLKGCEKAGLIYVVEPYGSATKMTKKPNKYYFASPTLEATQLWGLNKLNLDSDMMGYLLETYIADILERRCKTNKTVQGVFYDYEKRNADFIVQTRDGRKIAIEVGWGSKDGSQVLATLDRYDGEYGLVISSEAEDHKVYTKKKNDYDIFFVPKEAMIIV